MFIHAGLNALYWTYILQEVRHQSRKSKNIEIARHELYDTARGNSA